MRRTLSVFALVMTLGPRATAQTAADVDGRCARLETLNIPGILLTISRAEWFPAGSTPAQEGPLPVPHVTLPAYCRVDGVIDKRNGADGQPFGIGFALAMPAEWNGRFLMQGGAGLNGFVAPPLGAIAAGDAPALVRHFAVVSTDTGHRGNGVFDAAFMRDQQAALDFAYIAIGRVANLAKEIVTRYYGRPADHSYFSGCSTGGREGMVMAQRYPTYFDGIVSGAPAMRTRRSNIAVRSMVIAFNQIAPRDAAGKPLHGQAFSDRDRQTIIEGVVNACDANDGLKDGLIFDTRGCTFDPSTLVCGGAKTDGCLSHEQAAALAKAFAGPRDSKGHQVYSRFPYDTGIAATGRVIPGALSPSAGPPGPPVTEVEQDIDREELDADTDPQAILTDTSSWTNLSTFSSRGGKLIFFHGVSDPWFSALDTVDYYERLTKAAAGEEQAQAWSRLFLSPAMGHCGGGPNALDQLDLLSAVVDWVEKGTAPDSVRATSQTEPGRSRPLCAYPRHAHYKGSGNTDDATNFECRR